MSQLVDRFNRVHDYLRISVTDRCNLRCVYCMPPEGVQFMDHHQLLTYEQIEEVVRVGASLGIRKIRLTGGEPLVRRDLEVLVEKLSRIEGIKDIALTTNAMFLAQKAEVLKKAGLTRVNVSLDSLRHDRFKEITRGGDLKKVLDGIDAAYRVGFSPIKINTVLMKGFNDDEIGDFLRMTIDQPVQVRFIEYMPIGHADETWKSGYLSLELVKEKAKELGFELEESGEVFGNGPSENFRIKGAKGSIGFIHPISDHFCANCNRLRLTSDGYIKPCLYWQEELNVKPYLGDEEGLKQLYYKALNMKPENHEMAKTLNNEELSHIPTQRRMSQIGG
ncbi:GTP 3',8-cyclase MoaA [Tepidibacillus infernus]|uniref:GTP 3',8-cyclase n=1 Tax=Tepidibacillus decaturensis TaxID=1413211 RepID=A0A135L4H0_9BACI|nr:MULTISPECIES: GTP 3',8-cyclase MoaA [Tepidibacillus]KXG43830.1 cyclic pyranopterin phosphate synthase MoaA [Tepidibacillus decaturensis]GBF11120.1 cyclic pyranopterin monophosphate synthase [Tepidibacillus sp. HK-1]